MLQQQWWLTDLSLRWCQQSSVNKSQIRRGGKHRFNHELSWLALDFARAFDGGHPSISPTMTMTLGLSLLSTVKEERQ
jgi:hypothetical protein